MKPLNMTYSVVGRDVSKFRRLTAMIDGTGVPIVLVIAYDAFPAFLGIVITVGDPLIWY